MMIEPDLPNVFVVAILSEHKEVLNRVNNRVISRQELLCAAIKYWLENIRPASLGHPVTLEDGDLWDAIHEALYALPEWQQQSLADFHAEPFLQAVYSECDSLSHDVMQIAEDLSGVLSTMGRPAEGITHICRVEWDDFAMYLYCNYQL